MGLGFKGDYMRKRRMHLPVLLATMAIVLSLPGVAAAERAGSASEEQVGAAAMRIMAGQGLAGDVALVKRFPRIARQVPDPSGLSMTVTTEGLPPSKRPAGGVAAAAAENCAGFISLDIWQTSVAGSLIYKWRHDITACTDGVNVTRFVNRYEQLVASDGTIEVKDPLRINQKGATPHPLPWSHYQRLLVQCIDINSSVNCIRHYPWSKIWLYPDHTWNADWGAGPTTKKFPEDGGRVPW
jgi:hypothetical protein